MKKILNSFSKDQLDSYERFLDGSDIFETPKRNNNGVFHSKLKESFLDKLNPLFHKFAKNEKYSGLRIGLDDDSKALCFLEAIERAQFFGPASLADGKPKKPEFYPAVFKNRGIEKGAYKRVALKSLTGQGDIIVPEACIFHSSEPSIPSLANSTGMATGLNISHALELAKQELIERRLYEDWWLGKGVDTKIISNEDLVEYLGHSFMTEVTSKTNGLIVLELKIKGESGINTCYLATSYGPEQSFFCYGTSTNKSQTEAIKKAITELVQVQVNDISFLFKLDQFPFLRPLTHETRNKLNTLLSSSLVNFDFPQKDYFSHLYYYVFSPENHPFSVVKIFDPTWSCQGAFDD